MLSLNDFREKQILFVQNSRDGETEIKFRNDNVVYLKGGKIVNQISCYKVLAIFMIGDASFTTVFLRKSVEFGISIFLMKNNFENYISIESKAEGNYLLRMKQYEKESDLEIAKKIVENKMINQSRLICKEKKSDMNEYKKATQAIIEKVYSVKDEKELLGIEGNFSKNFFADYFGGIGWYKRSPRTKVDEHNLLLDMGYTFLLNYVDSLLRLYGFDVYKGYYHKLFFKRKSLSCDIMEPFRCIIDKQLLKSFHLKQINKKDFKFVDGHFYLDYEKSKKYADIFLKGILEHKEEIFNFIYDFYRYTMDNSKKFPFFEIK
ncbi:MAG: type V CRISPR-associated endonuclease Cas1 [bacterium]